MNASSTVRALIPSFAYEDAHAAIAFLCDAFGFEKHAVYEDANGTIEHAQLKLGAFFIMLGTAGRNPDWPSSSPKTLGGTTGGTYVVLESDADVDAHYAHAKAAGAHILREPKSPEYGGRDYSARDAEGYLWSFGSYRPEAAP
jgi:uncharacterized glyoxalase superfamily protein PhnB